MAPKKVIVEGDPVKGTDTHKVKGEITVGAGTSPYGGTGRFDYVGSMTEALSDLVAINDVPVALITSRSSLDQGEDTTGKHSGPKGAALGWIPPAPTLIVAGVKILDTVGPGKPSASAGSGFVMVDGDAVLLDGDAIDTCDFANAIGNSKVTAEGQSLVEVTE